MKIYPTKGNIVVKKIKQEKEVSGLYIPTERESDILEVVEVYEGSKIEAGSKIIAKKFSGTDVEVGEKLTILSIKDVLGLVK